MDVRWRGEERGGAVTDTGTWDCKRFQSIWLILLAGDWHIKQTNKQKKACERTIWPSPNQVWENNSPPPALRDRSHPQRSTATLLLHHHRQMQKVKVSRKQHKHIHKKCITHTHTHTHRVVIKVSYHGDWRIEKAVEADWSCVSAAVKLQNSSNQDTVKNVIMTRRL